MHSSFLWKITICTLLFLSACGRSAQPPKATQVSPTSTPANQEPTSTPSPTVDPTTKLPKAVEPCWVTAVIQGSLLKPKPPVPFLYLPFNGELTWQNWTSQMDHASPTYSQGLDGTIATLGQTLSKDDKVESLFGGTQAYIGNKNYKLFPSTISTREIVNQGYKILGYQSPLFESYLYYDGHDGHDFGVSGNALVAADGKVVFRDWMGSFGRVVEIYHPQGYLTRYAHLANFDESVQIGANVKAGQSIGKIGGSGIKNGIQLENLWGIHLHFTVYRWNPIFSSWNDVDPFGWDTYARSNAEDSFEIEKKDPLFACNGEISYNLWVDGWPRSVTGGAIQTAQKPVGDQYLGGWIGDLPEYPEQGVISKWIAYVGADENIWLVDLEGNKQQLTQDGVSGPSRWNPVVGYRNLKWSPDGTLLGATRIDENGTRILAIRISDSVVLPLTTNTEGSFDWLPDSKSIIFSTIPFQSQYESPGGLSFYNLDTGQITPFIETKPNIGLVRPDWSDQGEHVYFSMQPAPVPNVIWGDKLGLTDKSGREIVEVINSAYSCDWNPDGQSLVCRFGSGEILCSDLVIFSATGTVQSEISPGSGCTQTLEPDWSPDGNLIAFRGEVGNQRGMFVVTSVGSDLIYLGEDSLKGSEPEWSPNSKKLAFLSDRNGNVDVFVVDIDNNQAVNLTNTTGDERGLAWQPGIPSQEILPTPTASPPASQLDLSDPDSIVYWLAYDLAHGTSDSFSKVITEDSLLYGDGLSGGRDPMDRQTFLAELSNRIQSKPTCVGVIINRSITPQTIMLWTKGWQPLWDFHGKPKSEEMTFSFFIYEGQIDTWAYFTPSSAILELPSVKHDPCPSLAQEAINSTSIQEDNKKYGQLTNQFAEVNLRSTPGYVNKDDSTDVIVKIPSGEPVEIIGGPEEKDGLSWWNITWNGYAGWIADHTASGIKILDFGP